MNGHESANKFKSSICRASIFPNISEDSGEGLIVHSTPGDLIYTITTDTPRHLDNTVSST